MYTHIPSRCKYMLSSKLLTAQITAHHSFWAGFIDADRLL